MKTEVAGLKGSTASGVQTRINCDSNATSTLISAQLSKQLLAFWEGFLPKFVRRNVLAFETFGKQALPLGL